MVMEQQDDLERMAECWVEEFARMGYSEDALVALFRNPFYQGPHLAWQQKGEPWVREMIGRVVGA
jgi:hypothetical protein